MNSPCYIFYNVDLCLYFWCFLPFIPGSPFQYTVGTLVAGGTHKVEIGGTGLEKGEVKMKSK
jgi:hypothetical protein